MPSPFGFQRTTGRIAGIEQISVWSRESPIQHARVRIGSGVFDLRGMAPKGMRRSTVDAETVASLRAGDEVTLVHTPAGAVLELTLLEIAAGTGGSPGPTALSRHIDALRPRLAYARSNVVEEKAASRGGARRTSRTGW